SLEDDNLKWLEQERAKREPRKRTEPVDFQSGLRGGSKPQYQGEPIGHLKSTALGTEPSHGTQVESGQ
ncbi:hypothetical protein HAX54_050842, partial [Datura stramonium]|nr:hypothetical protein [Datura stramonium]